MSGADDRAEPPRSHEPAGWTPEIEEIRRRRDLALAMGGPEKVARQRASGRLTVRERIERLADPGSFAEIGALTGFGDYDGDGRLTSVLPANFVAGTARIDGRPVLIGADDFTVRGGSGDAAIHAKQIYSPSSTRTRCGCRWCGCWTARAAAAASRWRRTPGTPMCRSTRRGTPWSTTCRWSPWWRRASARRWGSAPGAWSCRIWP